ncbi:MAG: hypothetical protein HFH05_06405 [Lachnospiraceae bacterium]|jgi:hypothetical protein|nr:hypothetical protein [Lachnospiraceae bacterium]
MRKFWGYISNEEYAVGCTGQTVFVYDREGKELAKFKDIKYGCMAMFSPDGKLFVVKSTGAYFGVYLLDTLRLIYKVKFSDVDGSQDDGYCFSADGKYFYNIERQKKSFNGAISVYTTSDFKRAAMFLDEDKYTEPSWIETGTDGWIYVLGFLRGEDGVICDGFISRFGDNGIEKLCVIPIAEYEYYRSFKKMESYGFTDKAKEMFLLKYTDADMGGIENTPLPLENLWRKYSNEEGSMK